MAEGLVDLVVEVDAVGHQHDLRVVEARLQGDRLGQHDHRERLAAPLGVPDDAPGPLPLLVAGPDPLEDPLDAEELLVAGDLLLARVEEGVAEHQPQEPLGPAQGVEGAVLVGDRPPSLASEVVEVGADGPAIGRRRAGRHPQLGRGAG